MTSRELAKLAGVSQATVSLCLNDSPLVADKTKEKVLKLVKEYKFELNSQARALKMQKSNAVGIIFPKHFVDFNVNPYFNIVYTRIRRNLLKFGIDLMVIYDNEFKNSSEYVLKLMRKGKIDGLISFKTDFTSELSGYFEEKKIPCIYLLSDEGRYFGKPCVITDTAYGASLVADCFADCGFDKVMTVATDIETSDSSARTRDFAKQLEKRKVPFQKKDILYFNRYAFEEGRTLAVNHFSMIKEREYQAAYIQSDTLALGFMEGLKRMGMRLPDEMKIVGHDDQPMDTWFYPTLSSVTSLGEDAAKAVSRLVINELNGKGDPDAKIIFKPSLILRESCHL